MKNQKWLWRKTFKGATGGAANSAVAGLIAGSFVPDPTGVTIATTTAIGALTGFVGSVTGDAVAYVWDDQFYPFASRPLYIFVVGLLISVPLLFAVILFGELEVDVYKWIASIAFVSNLLSASSAGLIDDIRARKARGAPYESEANIW